MILTGVLMFFLNMNLSPVAIFFMVHVYMAAIAIKGAIHSMITGYKEEEVKILHSSWYRKLKEEGKV